MNFGYEILKYNSKKDKGKFTMKITSCTVADKLSEYGKKCFGRTTFFLKKTYWKKIKLEPIKSVLFIDLENK